MNVIQRVLAALKSTRPAVTGQAVVTVTEVCNPIGVTTTVAITGTAEQVRTAQQVMNSPTSTASSLGLR
jgi:hypothetical protein